MKFHLNLFLRLMPLKRIRWGALAGLLLLQSQLFAAPENIEQLLEMPLRPSVSDIIAVLPLDRKEHPFEVPPKKRNEFRNKYISERLPSVIASMEFMFPGATFAPLGRDVAFLGDLIDAFYLSIGQQGRVSRLNGSSGTIRGVDAELLVRFLESAGLDIENFRKAYPFVIFDRTNFRQSSQTRQLLDAAMARLRNEGYPIAEIVRRLGGMKLYQNDESLQIESRESYFTQGANSLESQQTLHQLPNIAFGRIFSDGLAWHNAFGALAEYEGKFMGPPGALATVEARQWILAELYECILRIFDDSFRKAVIREAKALGYEFPMDRRVEVKPISKEELERIERERREEQERLEREREEERRRQEEERRKQEEARQKELERKREEERLAALKHLESATESLHKIHKSLPNVGEHKNYYSDAGQPIADWIAALPNAEGRVRGKVNRIIHFLISNLIALNAGERISPRDFRRLLARGFGKAHPTEEFIEGLMVFYERSPEMREILNKRQGVFTSSNQSDKERVAAIYLALEKAFACKSVIIRESQGDG